MTISDQDKKEIVYRSLHRGCKETDFLIGRFVEQNIENLEVEDLFLLKELVIEDDLMIYDWVLGKKKPFEKYLDLIGKIRVFHKIS